MKLSDAMEKGRQMVPGRAWKTYIDWDTEAQTCIACDLGAAAIGKKGQVPTRYQISSDNLHLTVSGDAECDWQLLTVVDSPVVIPDIASKEPNIYNIITWMNDYYPEDWPTSRVVEWLRSLGR